MLSALAVCAVATALAAGVTGAWSPCGFSMVDTIGSALGDTRRSATRLACATFAVGAVIGGIVTFGGLALAGEAVARGGDGLREAGGAAIAIAAAIADWRGVRIAPQIRRQVPESWRWTLPLPVACGLYGVLLGLGFTTFVLAFAVWALAGISFAAGSPLLGASVGVAFGVGRALPILAMAPGMSGGGAVRLEEMAAEPRLWLGLRRLDALGLTLCAVFLSVTATAAGAVPAATDPSAAGPVLAWQSTAGPGMLRTGSGRGTPLPGDFPALSRSLLAWDAAGQVTVTGRASSAVTAVLPAPGLDALTLSDAWLAYRERAGAHERLIAVSLRAPGTPRALVATGAPGQLGRPALEGSTLVYASSTSSGAAIVAVELATGARRTLRFSPFGASFANPALFRGRLLYERLDRCAQELRLGSAATSRRDRILLTLPSTVTRDPGYQRGYEHAWNSASPCANRHSGPGGSTTLGATALTASAAFVTEIPSRSEHARIVTLGRGAVRAATRAASVRTPPAPRPLARLWEPDVRAATRAASVRTPPAPRPLARLWEPDVRAAVAYAHTRLGEVSFAARTRHRSWGWRATRTVPSASVLKAMLLVAYLDDPRVRDRPLGAADHRLIDPMIQRSDNAAATAVLGFVGASGVYGVAHRAGMREFALDPVVWGLSRIDAGDQTRFFLDIDSQVVARHRATAMHLLETVTPSQRWGIGRLRLPGWQLYFKGGWGAGTGEVEHQVALLRHGGTRLSVAVMITSSPSHEYARQTLRGVFAALLRGVGRLLPHAGRAQPSGASAR